MQCVTALGQQRAEGKTVARTSSKGTSSRSKGFTTANGKTMEVLHDPHVRAAAAKQSKSVPLLGSVLNSSLFSTRRQRRLLPCGFCMSLRVRRLSARFFTRKCTVLTTVTLRFERCRWFRWREDSCDLFSLRRFREGSAWCQPSLTRRTTR